MEFLELLYNFAQSLQLPPPEWLEEDGSVVLELADQIVTLYPGRYEGSVRLQQTVAIIKKPLSHEHLLQLVEANFCEIETSGTILCLGKDASSVELHTFTPPSASVEDLTQSMERLIAVHQEWQGRLRHWPELEGIHGE